MSIKLLIDNIIGQTMVLVAHVATAAGLRAPLAHVANQVFLDLVTELEQQGVTRKVAADMFGLALRSYQQKVQRLAESANDRGRSSWEAVLKTIQDEGEISRGDLLARFSLDGTNTIASILRDLSESGLVERDGAGAATRYRAISDEARALALGRDQTGALATLAWSAVFHLGETSPEALAAHLRLDPAALESTLDELEAEGRIKRRTEGERVTLTSADYIIPVGEPLGWEAAVLDHFRAMVTAIIAKLRDGKTRSDERDGVGGSTWSFVVWPGHPQYDEVMDLLASDRARVSPLREKVAAYNDAHPKPETGARRVTFYIGQNIVHIDNSENGGQT